MEFVDCYEKPAEDESYDGGGVTMAVAMATTLAVTKTEGETKEQQE